MNESKLIKAFTGMKEVTISINAKYSISFPGEIKKIDKRREKSSKYLNNFFGIFKTTNFRAMNFQCSKYDANESKSTTGLKN